MRKHLPRRAERIPDQAQSERKPGVFDLSRASQRDGRRGRCRFSRPGLCRGKFGRKLHRPPFQAASRLPRMPCCRERFLTTPSNPTNQQVGSAFISVFDAAGANLLYSSLYGYSDITTTNHGASYGVGVAVDASGILLPGGEPPKTMGCR